jgi:hypothetical protein
MLLAGVTTERCMEDYSSRSTAELVSDVAGDVTLLVRKELELARTELLRGLKVWGIGGGLVVFAAVASLPGLFFLVIALALWLPFSAEVGFAIVGGGMLAFALLGIAVGVWMVKRRKPGVGTAVDSIKEDVRWARGHLTR